MSPWLCREVPPSIAELAYNEPTLHALLHVYEEGACDLPTALGMAWTELRKVSVRYRAELIERDVDVMEYPFTPPDWSSLPDLERALADVISWNRNLLRELTRKMALDPITLAIRPDGSTEIVR